MGFYIETATLQGKAEVIAREYGAEVIPQPASFADVPAGKGLVCVVQNPLFDAAGFCYDEHEFAAFTAPDSPAADGWSGNVLTLGTGGPRPRIWLLMDYEKAAVLSGYRDRFPL